MTLLSPVFSSLVLPKKKDTTTTWSVVLAPQVSNVKNDELLAHFLRSGVMTDNREVTSSGTMKAWLLLCKGRNCFAPGLPWRMNQLVRKQQSSACVSTIRSDPNAKDRRRFCPFWRASSIMYLLQEPHSLRCVTPFLIRLQATSGGQQLCRCYGYRPVPSVTTALPDGLVQSTRHARRIGGICRRGRWNRKASEQEATKCQACNRLQPPREWRRPAGCFGASLASGRLDLTPWKEEGVRDDAWIFMAEVSKVLSSPLEIYKDLRLNRLAG